ncbi:ribosome small subunit-dependent GTPase A [Brevibacillus humidisoli]|uniref:ribosome small subunit-dependent GTPase A n=1 Tax=Brevibacillus humidisoli TaxID=2895522 RepID=UPI001E4A582B|nr:ribosome small subunit-dependent GTPase A [Brevibacillus humidisoli]UFJ40574.1 ribosome small subunit-dependent GTPase A [Brevibacillus humidisoli]
MELRTLGWSHFFQQAFAPYQEQGFVPGRVALEHQHLYRVYSEYGELLAEIAGKIRHMASGREDYPAVGDWVVLRARPEEQRATIQAILPRISKFSRKAAGRTLEEQIVAANVDTVFLVNALNHDFNLRRMERYLILAWESGANPVIVLSKADLCAEREQRLQEVNSIAFGVPVHLVSSVSGEGINELFAYAQEGQTVALLGSSGAGKSTLVNRLYGEEIQEVQEVRQKDDRGRHTTTHREMILLPGGGLLIDTPGMRELQLWDADEGFGDAFEDIEALAAECYFRDCSHHSEPRCAVNAAIEDGRLERSRLDSYRKLQRELAYLARKDDRKAQAAEREKWKKVSQQLKQQKPHRNQ